MNSPCLQRPSNPNLSYREGLVRHIVRHCALRQNQGILIPLSDTRLEGTPVALSESDFLYIDRGR
jgi:hypothetical protein